MSRMCAPSILSLLVAVAACADPGSNPMAIESPQLAKAPSAFGCAVNPTVVVTDEVGLFAAVGDAIPGDVIAIDGTISITSTLFIPVPDVTLTCATAGSGLEAGSFLPLFLVQELESGGTVSNLVLDGSNTDNGAFRAFRTNDLIVNAADYTLTGNTITCGFVTCIFR